MQQADSSPGGATPVGETPWSAAERALIAGDDTTLDALLRQHVDLFATEQPPARAGGLAPDYDGGDARAIILRTHFFETWPAFETFRDELRREGSAIARFEAAADAIVTGDLVTLDRLLTEDPTLVHARSPRTHRSALVHYVAANGVEYFRQRTPPNIVAVAHRVLDAGADVNATADMYGGNATTFGLFATSILPVLAGVLDEGLQSLLDRGASIGSGAALINACHANGRPEAAEWLAARGLDLDLEAAAGVGRLDAVQLFFTDSGALQNATPEQMRRGFAWACEYGKARVVEFLLRQGMDVGARLPNHGQTGLHWAAGSGYPDVARLLLDHGASVHARDEAFGVTPLAWAIHGWLEGPRRGSTPDDYYRVVRMLVSAGSEVDPQWLAQKRVRADEAMRAALTEK
jgi:hypothetical protein